jgi:hypothetical protein
MVHHRSIRLASQTIPPCVTDNSANAVRINAKMPTFFLFGLEPFVGSQKVVNDDAFTLKFTQPRYVEVELSWHD